MSEESHYRSLPVRDEFTTQASDAEHEQWEMAEQTADISFSFGFPFPDSFPTDSLHKAAVAVLEDQGGQALQYGGGNRGGDLIEFLAARYQDRGLDCSSEELALTNGAVHALDLLIRLFHDLGDSIMVAVPTFVGALNVFRRYGLNVVSLNSDTAGIDVAALAKRLSDRQSKGEPIPEFLYTIPTFHNPTGVQLSLERRDRLLSLAREFDFFVVEDAAYARLQYEGSSLPSLKHLDEDDRVIQLGTFSKTIAPGVRTGWVLADRDIVGALKRINSGGPTTFTRAVLGQYCSTTDLDQHINDLRCKYRSRRDRMLQCLGTEMPSDVRWTTPAGGFFVWVTVPPHIDVEELLPVAADCGVSYLPGTFFYQEAGYGTEHLRLSFSRVPLIDINRGIKALSDAIASE